MTQEAGTSPGAATAPLERSVPPAVFGSSRGTVTSFDDHVGAGSVTDGHDGRIWWFHCTSIADGSRSIEVGAQVGYVLAPGPSGIEATQVAVVA